MGGYVVVDHDVDVGNVEPAAGDVGGDEDGAALGLELVEGAEPLVLRHVAVQRDGGHPEAAQHQRELHRAGAGRAGVEGGNSKGFYSPKFGPNIEVAFEKDTCTPYVDDSFM